MDVSCKSPLHDSDSDPEYIPDTDISDDSEILEIHHRGEVIYNFINISIVKQSLI